MPVYGSDCVFELADYETGRGWEVIFEFCELQVGGALLFDYCLYLSLVLIYSGFDLEMLGVYFLNCSIKSFGNFF